MGNPFNKGPLPLIEQGGKGDTMWDKCPPTYYVHFLANRCSRSTSFIRLFAPVSTCGWNSSRHSPPPNLHIHRNVPKGEEERGRFRLRISTELSAVFIVLGLEPFASGPTSPSVRTCLFVGSIRPLSSVIRRGFFIGTLVMWSLNDLVHAS